MSNLTLWLKDKNGATRQLGHKEALKLKKELMAGRGGPQITKLIENGYPNYLALDGEVYPLDQLTNYEEIC